MSLQLPLHMSHWTSRDWLPLQAINMDVFSCAEEEMHFIVRFWIGHFLGLNRANNVQCLQFSSPQVSYPPKHRDQGGEQNGSREGARRARRRLKG